MAGMSEVLSTYLIDMYTYSVSKLNDKPKPTRIISLEAS